MVTILTFVLTAKVSWMAGVMVSFGAESPKIIRYEVVNRVMRAQI